jgi:ATP-binding cassette subfamily B protein
MRVLRRLIGRLAPYRPRVAGAAVALVAAAGAVLGFGAALRALVDRGFVAGGGLGAALEFLLLVTALLALATFARAYLVSWLGERVAADLRRDVFANALRQPPSFFETARVGEIMSRLTADAEVLQSAVGSSASMALRNLLLIAGGVAMMAATSPKLTGVAFLVVPLVVAPLVLFGRRVRRLSRASQDRIADVSADVEETLGAVGTVQAFGQERAEAAAFNALVERAFGAARQRLLARAALAGVVILFVFTAIGLVLWIGGQELIAGRLSAGALSAFVFYAVVVAGSVGSVSEFWGDLQRAAGAAERIFELIDAAPAIVAPASPVPLPTPARGAIAFERVTFRYPSRPERAALDGFELAVAPGETVALVGPSGAGKSTVFRLALRFADPLAGRVLFDGVELVTCDPASLRARIALVPQEPVLFAGDVAGNIRYGRPDAREDEILAAAKAAHALEFVEKMPQGFATPLGEKGARLSAGQRQRIAIARAILRDPALLLLDEATSALDAESERLVQDALDRLAGTRTTLVIAHRLATVLRADRIVVMDAGRVVEQGTHATLSRAGGLYARLAHLQFAAAPAA